MVPSRSTVSDQGESIAFSDNTLPVGTILGEFEIIELIGEGGFGIVYRTFDHSLQRQVALKEYMPSGLASRNGGITVTKSRQHLDTFQAGLRSFINEARLLAQFDHPSLVKVHRFWEANGTAYMVMPFYAGSTLKNILRRDRNPLDASWLKQLLRHLLDVLEILHNENCLHRDISPDNILILENGRPLLLDFGAARRVISNMTQNLTVILKPGYAPIEQYAETDSMKQGPWTDIYALAAVVYFAITGKSPIPAVSRIVSDSQTSLAVLKPDHYDPVFLHTIDKALAVRPEDRLQNVAQVRTLLGLRGTASSSVSVFEPSISFPGSDRVLGDATVLSVDVERPISTTARTSAGFYGVMIFVLSGLITGGWLLVRDNSHYLADQMVSEKAAIDIPSEDRYPEDYYHVPDTVYGLINKESEEAIEESEIPVPETVLKPEIPSAPVSESHPIPGMKPAVIPIRKSVERVEPSTKTVNQPPALTGMGKEKVHKPSGHSIERIIGASLIEGTLCLSNRDFQCAAAKAKTVLQYEPDNAAAHMILKDANTGLRAKAIAESDSIP